MDQFNDNMSCSAQSNVKLLCGNRVLSFSSGFQEFLEHLVTDDKPTLNIVLLVVTLFTKYCEYDEQMQA